MMVSAKGHFSHKVSSLAQHSTFFPNESDGKKLWPFPFRCTQQHSKRMQSDYCLLITELMYNWKINCRIFFCEAFSFVAFELVCMRSVILTNVQYFVWMPWRMRRNEQLRCFAGCISFRSGCSESTFGIFQ